jgi:hypothetical protein
LLHGADEIPSESANEFSSHATGVMISNRPTIITMVEASHCFLPSLLASH